MFAVIASWHGPKLTNSGRGAVIVVQHATQALAPLDTACVSKMARFWADESVGQPLVIALGVIMATKLCVAVRNDSSPNRIVRSRQDSLMVRTNLSACAFRFGDRGGSFTDFTPTSATMSKNSIVNSGSRSWIR